MRSHAFLNSFISFFVFTVTLISNGFSQDIISAKSYPQYSQAWLKNDILKLCIYLPDENEGYYRGARFDWSGIVCRVEYDGHTFFGEWMPEHDPTNPEAICGPVNEFGSLGYEQAEVGDSFVKIGVGTLQRNTKAQYNIMHRYPFIKAGQWEIDHTSDTSITFKQNHTGPNGWGYTYIKRIDLIDGQPKFRISHALRNTGEKVIDTDVYNHHFFIIDDSPFGTNYELEFPFPVQFINLKDNQKLLSAKTNTITFTKNIDDEQSWYWTELHGFDHETSTHNSVSLTNHKSKIGIRYNGSDTLKKFCLWGKRWTCSPEPFIDIKLEPNQAKSWHYMYQLFKTSEPSDTQVKSVSKGSYPDITTDQNGDLHLVYARENELYYKKFTKAENLWSDEQTVGLQTEKVNRSDPEIVIDSTGNPHIIVGSQYAYNNGQEWIPIEPNIDRDTALAIDNNDIIYICKRGGEKGFIGIQTRKKGESTFTSLPDPDVSSGFKAGRNDHVYGDIAVSPVDNSIHVVYRHGTPTHCAYRFSIDGGKTWQGGGVTDDDREAPSIAVSKNGDIYIVTGKGYVYKKTGNPSQWMLLGQPIQAGRRDRPQIHVDERNSVYISTFGGQYACYQQGKWSKVHSVPSTFMNPIGFVKIVSSSADVYAVWEEGDEVHNDEIAGISNILFTKINECLQTSE
jgi:hypothetical protein